MTHDDYDELVLLRQQVQHLSMEVGEARGRNGVLEKQVHEVAQLEADEIANLQRSITRLRQVSGRKLLPSHTHRVDLDLTQCPAQIATEHVQSGDELL